MKTNITNRGFKINSFLDQNGYECSLQESSNFNPSVWLGLSKTIIMVDQDTELSNLFEVTDFCNGKKMINVINDALCSSRMALDLKNVELLLENMKLFIDGELSSKYNFKDSYGLDCILQEVIKGGIGFLELGVVKPDIQILAISAYENKIPLKNNQNSGWVSMEAPEGSEVISTMILTKDIVAELLIELTYFKENEHL